jgi:uncharacterized membrane protein (UPF0127 family)
MSSRDSPHRGLPVTTVHASSRFVRLILVLALAALLGILLGCAPSEMRRQTITLGGHELDVWVAEVEAQHLEGLQAVPPIEDGEGMLFVWDEPAQRTFSLKDLDYEVDVVFIGEDGRVLDVDTIGPDGQLVAESAQVVGWVVEVPGGWAQANDVAEGAELSLEGGP